MLQTYGTLSLKFPDIIYLKSQTHIWYQEFFSGNFILYLHAAAAKSLQSRLTLLDPIEGSPPGSPVPGILQARTLEWAAISFSNAWKYKVKVKSLSRVRFLGTPWTAAHQAPLSMGFSRQENWSGVPMPSLNTCITLAKSFYLPKFQILHLSGNKTYSCLS